MLALALTASRSSRSCANWIGIEDFEVAFAFDIECNNVLTEWEIERQKEIVEAMLAGTVPWVSSSRVTVERKKPIALNA